MNFNTVTVFGFFFVLVMSFALTFNNLFVGHTMLDAFIVFVVLTLLVFMAACFFIVYRSSSLLRLYSPRSLLPSSLS
ncbi:hypothetical protein BDZ45DRAFT_671034 [Acephala macrosclerotiorum]|nr:hypothetical protein BDZ45DRAFT_671034 [Acephala macrosclerotiorum]